MRKVLLVLVLAFLVLCTLGYKVNRYDPYPDGEAPWDKVSEAKREGTRTGGRGYYYQWKCWWVAPKYEHRFCRWVQVDSVATTIPDSLQKKFVDR